MCVCVGGGANPVLLQQRGHSRSDAAEHCSHHAHPVPRPLQALEDTLEQDDPLPHLQWTEVADGYGPEVVR